MYIVTVKQKLNCAEHSKDYNYISIQHTQLQALCIVKLLTIIILLYNCAMSIRGPGLVMECMLH